MNYNHQNTNILLWKRLHNHVQLLLHGIQNSQILAYLHFLKDMITWCFSFIHKWNGLTIKIYNQRLHILTQYQNSICSRWSGRGDVGSSSTFKADRILTVCASIGAKQFAWACWKMFHCMPYSVWSFVICQSF